MHNGDSGARRRSAVVVVVDKNLTKKINPQRTHEIPFRHRGRILTIHKLIEITELSDCCLFVCKWLPDSLQYHIICSIFSFTPKRLRDYCNVCVFVVGWYLHMQVSEGGTEPSQVSVCVRALLYSIFSLEFFFSLQPLVSDRCDNLNVGGTPH